MKTLPNDISRCTGYKCCMALKTKCKRWIENNKKDDKNIISISDFTPIKIKGKMSCKYQISRKRIDGLSPF